MEFVLECLISGVRAALMCGAFAASVIVIAPIVILVAIIVGGIMDLVSGGAGNNE